jgi:uncharacterized FAD-dependent dehydrogenase
MTFIGLGPTHSYAIINLLQKGYPGNNIRVIDKGKSILNRDRKADVLFGTHGAGGFSDGKLLFSLHKDQEINQAFTEQEVQDSFQIVKDITFEFHSDPDIISITKPEVLPENLTNNGIADTHQSGWGELSIKQAECYHVGTETSIDMITNMEKYLIDNGVELLFEEEVLDINPIDHVLVTNKNIYDYEKLFIAVGRASKGFVSKLYEKYKVPFEDVEYQIGGRFEMPYNDTVQELSKFQYDFKFTKEYSDKVSVRSFCVCHHSAKVVSEQHDGYSQVNGEGWGLNCSTEHETGLTNFGIIATVKGDNTELDKIIRKISVYGGKPWHIKGKNFNFKSSFKDPTYPCDNHVFVDLYKECGQEILQFIEDLKPALNHNDNWIMYFPEIKPTGSKVMFNKDLSIDQLPDIFILGDSGVIQCRGITPSAVTGIMATKWHILDKYEK